MNHDPSDNRRDPSVTFILPEESREFMTLIAVTLAVGIAVAMLVLILKELGEEPFGGYLVTHWKAIAPISGIISATAIWGAKRIWNMHKRFIFVVMTSLESRMITVNNQLIVKVDAFDHKLDALNTKVDTSIGESRQLRRDHETLRDRVQQHAIELAEYRGERRERERLTGAANRLADLTLKLEEENQHDA